MSKEATIVRYGSLRECLCACLGWPLDREPGPRDYWLGHNGSRPYRQNVRRWLANPKKRAWGWAEYCTKSIHLWVGEGCEEVELLGVIAHELAHLRRPRFKDNALEERKAAVQGRDAMYRDWETDRKSTRLNSSHSAKSRMPSSA